jgi:hypothetical protein
MHALATTILCAHYMLWYAKKYGKTSISLWPSGYIIGLACPMLQVRSRNNPKSLTFIFKSPKQGRSSLTKMSLQTDGDQRQMRAYIPVTEARQIIDIYKKSSSPEGVHLLAIGRHHCLLKLHESFN